MFHLMLSGNLGLVMMVCGVRDCIKLVNNLISLLSQLTEVQYLDFILDPDRRKRQLASNTTHSQAETMLRLESMVFKKNSKEFTFFKSKSLTFWNPAHD